MYIRVYQRQIQNPVKHLRWMYHFAKIVNGCQPLTSFAKHPSVDVWQGFEYDSEYDIFLIFCN